MYFERHYMIENEVKQELFSLCLVAKWRLSTSMPINVGASAALPVSFAP